MGSLLINSELWFTIGLTLVCGLMSALLCIPWGMFWGWLLARKNFKGKEILQVILYLPLVLSPVLIGYLLLLVFGRNSPFGSWLFSTFQMSFVFDWKGVVLASFVVSSPFMIEAMRRAYVNIDERLEWVARGLGADTWKTFFTITMPLARTGLMAGFFISWARSIGEFGATLILAGNISGKTQTISLAIFSLGYRDSTHMVWILIFISFVLAYLGLTLNHHYQRRAQTEFKK